MEQNDEPSPDQPLSDALPGLVQRAQELLEAGIGHKYQINTSDDSGCDPTIEFGETGIGVSIFWEAEKTSGVSQSVIHYGAYSTAYHPGVRYYPDGSGEPPSADLHELGESSAHPDGALTEALKAVVAHRISELQEWEADREDAAFEDGIDYDWKTE
jgi:hypothetical protein